MVQTFLTIPDCLRTFRPVPQQNSCQLGVIWRVFAQGVGKVSGGFSGGGGKAVLSCHQKGRREVSAPFFITALWIDLNP
jgi:hypothetical protein